MHDGDMRNAEHDEQPVRRSRRRRRSTTSHPGPDQQTGQGPVPTDPRHATPQGSATDTGRDEPADTAPARKPTSHRHHADGSERGMRDLVGAGPSQLGVSHALRGRDADRPTPEELAQAEDEVVLIRRHWTPGPS